MYAIEDDQPVFGKIENLIVTPSQECLFYHHSQLHEAIVLMYMVPYIAQNLYVDISLVDHYPLHLSVGWLYALNIMYLTKINYIYVQYFCHNLILLLHKI